METSAWRGTAAGKFVPNWWPARRRALLRDSGSPRGGRQAPVPRAGGSPRPPSHPPPPPPPSAPLGPSRTRSSGAAARPGGDRAAPCAPAGPGLTFSFAPCRAESRAPRAPPAAGPVLAASRVRLPPALPSTAAPRGRRAPSAPRPPAPSASGPGAAAREAGRWGRRRRGPASSAPEAWPRAARLQRSGERPEERSRRLLLSPPPLPGPRAHPRRDARPTPRGCLPDHQADQSAPRPDPARPGLAAPTAEHPSVSPLGAELETSFPEKFCALGSDGPACPRRRPLSHAAGRASRGKAAPIFCRTPPGTRRLRGGP